MLSGGAYRCSRLRDEVGKYVKHMAGSTIIPERLLLSLVNNDSTGRKVSSLTSPRDNSDASSIQAFHVLKEHRKMLTCTHELVGKMK